MGSRICIILPTEDLSMVANVAIAIGLFLNMHYRSYMLALSSPITARGALRPNSVLGLTGASRADCVRSRPEPSSQSEVDAWVRARTDVARRRYEHFMHENLEPRSRDGALTD